MVAVAPPDLVAQPSLFGSGEPAPDAAFGGLIRHELELGAWLDVVPGWLAGHQTLFDRLLGAAEWDHQQRMMYDRMVDVPRLIGGLPAGSPVTTIGVLGEARSLLEHRYGVALPRLGLALYRDGRDSVAWHGDQVARRMTATIVATVSLGEPRPFVLRPTGGGAQRRVLLGHGDLAVMGGTCQRTWQHAVPKVARAGPRLVMMFRPAWPDDA